MIVIGLLSTEEEAQELQMIAKICTIEDRIRHLVRLEKTKASFVKKSDSETTNDA
ncbi:MAG: hypothetical protein JXA00_00935 [Candidatus Thermoplasmatota archaeon]|nr:hypothetical protein [Candidatus Thermoplasmatota archaeon]